MTIQSEIEFPELIPYKKKEENSVDLKIKVGKTVKNLKGKNIIKKVYSEASPNEYLIEVLGLVKFYAFNGNTIIIEPLGKKTDWKSIRLFLLHTVMVAIVHQKNWLPLNAHALRKKDKVILLVGRVRTTKSILTALLTQRGYQLHSENICVIRPENIYKQQILTSGSCPMLLLHERSISRIKHPSFTEENQVRKNVPIFAFYYHDTFKTEVLPIQHIISLNNVNQLTYQKRVLKNFAEKANILNQFIAKKEMLSESEIKTKYFKSIIEITKTNIPIIELSFPQVYLNMSKFLSFVEKEGMILS